MLDLRLLFSTFLVAGKFLVVFLKEMNYYVYVTREIGDGKKERILEKGAARSHLKECLKKQANMV